MKQQTIREYMKLNKIRNPETAARFGINVTSLVTHKNKDAQIFSDDNIAILAPLKYIWREDR